MATILNVSNRSHSIVENKQKIGLSTDWRDLDKWFQTQEDFFKVNKIDSEQLKIRHSIINLDVRHWNKLEHYFKFNQQKQINYQMLKRILLKKVKRTIDPTMIKYDDKLESILDKVSISRLDLENMQIWLKRMRFECDGQAKEEYLTTKILMRVPEFNRRKVFNSLMFEVKNHIEVYESRIKLVNSKIGKQKTKELKKLESLLMTITSLID